MPIPRSHLFSLCRTNLHFTRFERIVVRNPGLPDDAIVMGVAGIGRPVVLSVEVTSMASGSLVPPPTVVQIGAMTAAVVIVGVVRTESVSIVVHQTTP